MHVYIQILLLGNWKTVTDCYGLIIAWNCNIVRNKIVRDKTVVIILYNLRFYPRA